MKKHFNLILIFILFIYSCSSDKHINPDKIFIVNYGPNGSIYTDPTGKTYVFRSVVTNIINETDIPLDLQINFSDKYRELLPSGPLKLKVFIMPDTMMPVFQRKEKKQYDLIANDEQVSTALEEFLNTKLKNPSSLKKFLEPNGGFCTMNIGMLFDPGDGQNKSGTKLHYNLFAITELFRNGQKHHLTFPDKSVKFDKIKADSIDITFDANVNYPKYYASFTCGQITIHK